MFSALISFLFPRLVRIEHKLDLLLQETAWLADRVRELSDKYIGVDTAVKIAGIQDKLKQSADALRASVDANKPK